MIEEIFRKYLEITSLKDFNDVKNPSDKYLVNRVDSEDFQINKFFYKNIGKKYQWIDRLVWADQNWIDYVSDNKLSTYILKDKEEMAGYFELIFYQATRETEIAYFGILEEYFNKKLGGFLLSEAIKISFSLGSSRVWVHTSSLDHKNALKNYIARGMKIFKSEILIRK